MPDHLGDDMRKVKEEKEEPEKEIKGTSLNSSLLLFLVFCKIFTLTPIVRIF